MLHTSRAPEGLVPTGIRLLALAFATLLVAPPTVATGAAALLVGYVVVALALGAATARTASTWPGYAGVFADVTAVAGLVSLTGGRVQPPISLLLLAPLVVAVSFGRGPVLLAGCLTALAVGASVALVSGGLGLEVLQSVGLLAVAGIALSLAADVYHWRRVAGHWSQMVDEARATADAEIRRERTIREAAEALASAHSLAEAGESVARAAASLAGVAVAVMGDEDGHLVAGDAELALAYLGPCSPERLSADAPLGLPTGGGLSIVVQGGAPRHSREDRARLMRWLETIRPALDRCRADAHARERQAVLERMVELLPIPVAAWSGASDEPFASAAYRTLGVSDERSRVAAGSDQEELVEVGEPARIFGRTTLRQDGLTLAAYREVTHEREALRTKDQLISMVGHELRTPLTSILGYSQMMSRHLGVVQQQVASLSTLIQDFMDAARLESGELPLQVASVQAADLARGAAERFRGAHDGRTLELRVEGGLPPVLADSARLGQVLDNLLGNAAKYSPPDRPITLSAWTEDDEVRIAVADQGVGIAAEHLPRVFERFFRVPGEATERAEGFGLGLAIVRDLVAAQQGRIWAESAGEGRGSTFTIALPRRPADARTGSLTDGASQIPTAA